MSIGMSWVLMTGGTLSVLGLLLVLASFLLKDSDVLYRVGQWLALAGVSIIMGTLLFYGFAGLIARTP